jgi:hypothetical protein
MQVHALPVVRWPPQCTAQECPHAPVHALCMHCPLCGCLLNAQRRSARMHLCMHCACIARRVVASSMHSAGVPACTCACTVHALPVMWSPPRCTNTGISRNEWELCVKLAAAMRLIEATGLGVSVWGHASFAVPHQPLLHSSG